jgi:hypothetical protein
MVSLTEKVGCVIILLCEIGGCSARWDYKDNGSLHMPLSAFCFSLFAAACLRPLTLEIAAYNFLATEH